MKNITFKKITEIEEANYIWDKLSPNNTYGNTWKFREIFNRINKYPLFFYAAFDGDKAVALLPLEYKTPMKYLTFFGGMHFEDNQIFVQPGYEKIIPELINQIEAPYYLTWMKNDLHAQKEAIHFDDRYELPLLGLESYEDYIEKYWHGKSKSKLKKKIKKLLDISEISYDSFELDDLARLNKKRFGEESSFLQPERLKYLKELSKLPGAHSITIKINGVVESTGFAFLYNNTYVGLNSGTNHEIDNLGKLIALLKINQAINLRAEVYDARGGELNWKKRFGLTPIPQFKLSNIND